MKPKIDYLIEYRNLKRGSPYEEYLDMLVTYLIYMYVNEIVAYVYVALFIVGWIGKSFKVLSIDDEIKALIYRMKDNENYME